jgi:hypothetical protein
MFIEHVYEGYWDCCTILRAYVRLLSEASGTLVSKPYSRAELQRYAFVTPLRSLSARDKRYTSVTPK